jgi:hypothetical protein
VDGGTGSDRVYAGRGDDTGHFNVTENQGFRNYYNGGSGNDHLVLKMTEAEYEAATADFAAYDAHLASSGHGCWGHHGRSFEFQSFDLKVKNWESYYVEITDKDSTNKDSTNGPKAIADTVMMAAAVIQEMEPNDANPDPANGATQHIGRDSFRYAPSVNVGDDSLPWVSIEGNIDPEDLDFYAFVLKAGETIILDIDFTNFVNDIVNELNSIVYVTDGAGTILAHNVFPDSPQVGGEGSLTTADAYLEYDVPTDGTYYVGVQGLLPSESGPYTLNVSIDNPGADLGAFVITAAELLENDEAADKNALTITSVDNSVNGSATLTAEGDVLFTPGVGKHPGGFEYTVSDGLGESTAKVVVHGEFGGDDGSNEHVSTSENELFFGDGAAERFNFSAGSGYDTIAGFEVGVDLLVPESGSRPDFQQLGGDTLVTFSTVDSVLLADVTGIAGNTAEEDSLLG